MMRVLFFFVAFHVLQTLGYKSSKYSSTVSLENLMEKQKYVIKQVKFNIANMEENFSEKFNAVIRYIEDYEAMVSSNGARTETLMHPISGFHFFKHVVTEWEELMKVLMQDEKIAILLALKAYRKLKQFPNHNDLSDISASIGRMQYMYQIPMEDMVNGVIRSNSSDRQVYKSRKGLDSWDCFTIGKATFHRDYVKPAVEWLETANKLAQKDNKVSKNVIKKLLNEAKTKRKRVDSSADAEVLEEVMGTLCRGENQKKHTLDKKLTCRYLTRQNPYLLIAPFKMEELSKDPVIVGFHDFLSEEESTRMKEIASPQLVSSKVMSEKDDGASFDRTSQQYWLEPTADPQLALGVSRRIERATGLYTEAEKPNEPYVAETYQVLNYGIGGLYLSHHDYYPDCEEDDKDEWFRFGGNRIATFLMYLNDVEVGGATVFPKADVTIWPKRGFAAFWYNLHMNGEQNPNTQHGGCPVMYGSKWISNKWIHIKHQDNDKCGLHEDEVRQM